MNFRCEFCEMALNTDLDVSRHLVSLKHRNKVDEARQRHPQGKGNEVPRNIPKLFENLKLRTREDVRDLADRKYFHIPSEASSTVDVVVAITKILAEKIADNLTRDFNSETRNEIMNAFRAPARKQPPAVEAESTSRAKSPSVEPTKVVQAGQATRQVESRATDLQPRQQPISSQVPGRECSQDVVPPSQALPSNRLTEPQTVSRLRTPEVSNLEKNPLQSDTVPKTWSPAPLSSQVVPSDRASPGGPVVRSNAPSAVQQQLPTDKSRLPGTSSGQRQPFTQGINAPPTVQSRPPSSSLTSRSGVEQIRPVHQQLVSRAIRSNGPQNVQTNQPPRATAPEPSVPLNSPRLQQAAQPGVRVAPGARGVPRHPTPSNLIRPQAASQATRQPTPMMGACFMPRPLMDEPPPQPRLDSNYRPMLAKIKVEPKDKN